jgi:hypothetical protein
LLHLYISNLLYCGQGLGEKAAEKTSTFGFIIEGVLLTAISVFGLVGNIVAIIVLSRNRRI